MNKKTLDDIFNDDDFGLLDIKTKTSNVKTEENRLIDAFEEINLFIDKNHREPNTSSMSEYGLYAKLRNFKENETDKKTLKPYDRHNLLGHVEIDELTIDDIFNDDDLGLLETDNELDIFKYKHISKSDDRAKTDFVAKRKPLKEKEFEKYEKMFQKIHQEIKEGKRRIETFNKYEENLIVGNFYMISGVLLYLESADLKKEEWIQKSGNRVRLEGRTRTIFENKTHSNMLFRSLGKQIEKNGKMITNINENTEQNLFINTDLLNEEDIKTGWIYVLKSKSVNPNIANFKDLYKIGYSSTSVDERIKNAKNEATYLFADVKKIATYQVYNRNADKLESLLHRFFAQACLNVDLFDTRGQRITPREWFVVPFDVIEEVIHLILNESIMNYEYDVISKKIKLKQ
ncbi:MAG: GIY-YIG nuclease family protein [Sulfuricurvum sp.]|uniref:GIY-YIG nuclease family protein n=1 Tax=Sulfuricurvum sp. TaxID=2025608 RepID=UPI00356A2A2B